MDPIEFHIKKGHISPAGEHGEWLSLPEIPSSQELLAARPRPILPNPIDRPYRSRKEYFETQYQLLRHEAIEPLRSTINVFRQTPDMSETFESCIYTEAHVKGYLLNKAGAACRVSFSTKRCSQPVNWSQSERLMPGSMVALSYDHFRSHCSVAIVLQRPFQDNLPNENAEQTVDIQWASPHMAVYDPVIELVMVEATKGYFEANRHVMAGLQHAYLSHSRFDKQIIYGLKEDQSPLSMQAALPNTIFRPDSAKGLDTTQEKAFQRILTREMTIIQGPPGTGKTFTSIVALESFIESMHRQVRERPMVPIIVAAQTNHALDQLLSQCLERNIGKIVRLGGHSSHDQVLQYSMARLRRRNRDCGPTWKVHKHFGSIMFRCKELLQQLSSQEPISPTELHIRHIITFEQLESLTQNDYWEGAKNDHPITRWMGSSHQTGIPLHQSLQHHVTPSVPEEHEKSDSQPDEDDTNALRGLFVPLEPHLAEDITSQCAKSKPAWWQQARHYIEGNNDLYDIKPSKRGLVYRYLLERLMDQLLSEVPMRLEDLQAACDDLKICQWRQDVDILHRSRITIIGCTTTGLTKYRGLLAAMKPRVLFIEEAAETREANITSALFPSLEQLVLIGDHQQLAPHVDVRPLEFAPYHLNVSLFERLIRLHFPYTTLEVQRRMAPRIREVVQVFYPEMRDHPSVTGRSQVPGMGRNNIWWFQHDWPQSRNARLSYYNTKEAELVVDLTQHLVRSGFELSQVTILTYYTGQVEAIQEKLREAFPALLDDEIGCSVRTVDSFQGEENDIVILSLVRSPSRGGVPNAGFVEVENRAVVATSRARHGFYVFGNVNNLLSGNAKSGQTWQKVFDVFERQGCTGFDLAATYDPAVKASGVVSLLEAGTDSDISPHDQSHRQFAMNSPGGSDCDALDAELSQASPLSTLSSKVAGREVVYRSSEELMEQGYFQLINRSRAIRSSVTEAKDQQGTMTSPDELSEEELISLDGAITSGPMMEMACDQDSVLISTMLSECILEGGGIPASESSPKWTRKALVLAAASGLEVAERTSKGLEQENSLLD